jgi:hypothetical protein
MFKFIVLLNQAPFYIFAMTEKETLDTVKVYREKVIGVIEGDNLNFKTLEVSVVLKTQKVEGLDFVEIVNEDYKTNKVDVLLDPEEHEEMIEDIQSDIN